MFVLIGEGYHVVQHLIGGDFEQVDFEEQVALFDGENAEADARAYAESYRLTVKRHQSAFDSPTVFRQGPMHEFVSYRIDTYEVPNLPLNPVGRRKECK